MVLLVVLVTLPCCLARRGRGGQQYRTEAERRETRRKLLEQRDPRRAGWSGSATRSRAGEVERRRQSLENQESPLRKHLHIKIVQYLETLSRRALKMTNRNLMKNKEDHLKRLKLYIRSKRSQQKM